MSYKAGGTGQIEDIDEEDEREERYIKIHAAVATVSEGDALDGPHLERVLEQHHWSEHAWLDRYSRKNCEVLLWKSSRSSQEAVQQLLWRSRIVEAISVQSS